MARPVNEPTTPFWLFPAIALVVGLIIGAAGSYLIFGRSGSEPPPPTLPPPTSSPSPKPSPTPSPTVSPGPTIPPGPDAQAQKTLLDALAAEKKYYSQASPNSYSANPEALKRLAPAIEWEPGVTPSRAGLVAVMLCGPPDDRSSPVLLQSIGGSGRIYGILDVPTGPAASVYYGSGQQAFGCPNSIPPPSPWQRTYAGWGISTGAAPQPTYPGGPGNPEDDWPVYPVEPTTGPTPTRTQGTSTPQTGPTYYPF